MKIRLELKWADLWIGKYHKLIVQKSHTYPFEILKKELHIWICIIPCVPIHLIFKLLIDNSHLNYRGLAPQYSKEIKGRWF